MALDRLRPSLLGVVMALMFGSVIVQVESYQEYVLCDNSTPSRLRVDPLTPPFNIKSPGYPISDYKINLNCPFVLESSEQPLVLLFSFVNFTLEGESMCRYDSLCLAGVKYCGSWESGYVFQKILPSYRTWTIHFKTDHSVSRRGFNIAVIPQVLTFGQTIQEVGGNGASYSGLNFTANTFHPNNPYTDQCALQSYSQDRLYSLKAKGPGGPIAELDTTNEPPK